MSGQLVVPAWYAPAALAVPLAFASPVAYRIGAGLAPSTGGRPTLAAVLLVLVASVHCYGRRKLYSHAAAVDAALDEADRDAGEQHVILSRSIERREHERLLHDTVINTLTAITRAGRDEGAEVVRRCRQDVALIEGALTGTGPGDGDAGSGGDVGGAVRAVAAEMRARGLAVHLEDAGHPAPGIPAAVATAVSNAVREALSNVAAHAGTGEAWVEVSRTAAHLAVTVRDSGAGFDPALVGAARLGLRRSITERLADCGGEASIWSAPGHGTVVRLSWPGTAEPARGSPPW
jgi:signal transduction histidine kinase